MNMGCPNKSARFKVCAIVVLLSWRYWKFNICHLSLLRLVVMEPYNKEQRVIIVKTHYKYGESYAETVRKFCGLFGRQNAPYHSTVQRRNKKFEERGLWTVITRASSYRPVSRQYCRRAWKCCWESRNIDSPLFTTIGHFEKHHAAKSHERSASACLQDSTDARTQANRPCAAPRIC